MSRPATRAEISQAVSHIRLHAVRAAEYAEQGDIAKAFAEAELAHHAAFDLKMLFAPELPQQRTAENKEG